jgi:serine/threonine-protein phosphatase 2A regulatory subunit B'
LLLTSLQQQFDGQPTQFQIFRRKSIIPVDESVSTINTVKLTSFSNCLITQVYNELSRHVSLDEVLSQAPGASTMNNA